MPTYEYKCQRCGEKFELKLGLFHKKSSVKCPKCGDSEPERVYSTFSTSGDSAKADSCAPRNTG